MTICVLYVADGESDSSDDVLKALEAVVDSKLWVWVGVGGCVRFCMSVCYMYMRNTKLQVCAWYVCVCLKASLCSGVCSPV